MHLNLSAAAVAHDAQCWPQHNNTISCSVLPCFAHLVLLVCEVQGDGWHEAPGRSCAAVGETQAVAGPGAAGGSAWVELLLAHTTSHTECTCTTGCGFILCSRLAALGRWLGKVGLLCTAAAQPSRSMHTLSLLHTHSLIGPHQSQSCSSEQPHISK